MSIISVRNLYKQYHVAERELGFTGALKGLFIRKRRTVQALADVNFDIDAGELVGYIGPNGAGKSTTVKILAGILVPTSGRCRVMKRVPWINRIDYVSRIGVVFGQRTQLWWDLPVRESFDLLAQIYRVPAVAYKSNLDELISMLDIEAFLSTPVRQLSLGQKMRCEIAAALLHNPPLVFLDEPTIGLDAPTKIALREFIKLRNRSQGTTLILTTHDMDDIATLCSRLMVIGDGQILFDGSLTRLRETVGSENVLRVDFSEAPRGLQINQVSMRSVGRNRAEFSYDPRHVRVGELIAEISQHGRIRDLSVHDAPIDHVIARFYREMKS